jgi:serine/threonine protein kinase
MWAYQPHKESFKEAFAQRIMGQLALGLCTMKHSGQLDRFHRGEITVGGAAVADDGPIVKGCFHRDVKLENIIVSGEFTPKLMDYGSLKFTDQASQVQVGDSQIK